MCQNAGNLMMKKEIIFINSGNDSNKYHLKIQTLPLPTVYCVSLEDQSDHFRAAAQKRDRSLS
jgi:hypothetical protein